MKLIIALTGAPDVSLGEREAAQDRYREVLEEVFGGPEGVWRRYQAAMTSMQSGLDRKRLPQQTLRDLRRWEEAAGVAAKLALGSLAIGGGSACFEVSREP